MFVYFSASLLLVGDSMGFVLDVGFRYLDKDMSDITGAHDYNNHVINIIWLIFYQVIKVEEKALHRGDRFLKEGEGNLH